MLDGQEVLTSGVQSCLVGSGVAAASSLRFELLEAAFELDASLSPYE